VRVLLWIWWAAAAVAAQGDVYLVHDDPAPMRTLAAFLAAQGQRAVVEDEAEFRAHREAAAPKAVVVYVHKPLHPELEEWLIRYAEGGGRLVVLHHGIASAKTENRRWLPFLGIRISKDEEPKWLVARGTFQLVNLRPDHYVTSHGVKYPSRAPYGGAERPAIELRETEAFLNQGFTDGDRKTVLFGFRMEADGKVYAQDRAGWLMPAGKGQVFYFQPGHSALDFENRDYAQIVLNALEWRP
jgi:hypothetical protein